MNKFIFLISAVFVLFTSSSSFADDEYVTFAKSLFAKDFDKTLPAQPIEQWLETVLPRNARAVWGKEVTDCGEQTGDPAIDRRRDMPLCVEIELKQNDKSVGSLLLFIGTEKKGMLRAEAGLYFGEFRRDNKSVWLKKLGDLAAIR